MLKEKFTVVGGGIEATLGGTAIILALGSFFGLDFGFPIEESETLMSNENVAFWVNSYFADSAMLVSGGVALFDGARRGIHAIDAITDPARKR